MAIFNIPKIKVLYKLLVDWDTTLEWEQRNLVLFRKLSYTGMKVWAVDKRPIYDEKTGALAYTDDGKIKMAEHTRSRTVINPLFVNDQGKASPVTVVFPAETTFTISRLRLDSDGDIRNVWIKIIDSPDKDIRKCVAEIPIAFFNGVEADEVSS